jgi:hypothetical protein
MIPKWQGILLYSVFWGGVILMFGYLAWLAMKYRKNIRAFDIRDLLAGKKTESDPDLAASWTRDVKRYRKITSSFFIIFVLLGLGLSLLNTFSPK